MNTLADQFTLMYDDRDDEPIVEKHDPNESTATPVMPIAVKALSGYESLMRRHAAACEAGR